MKKITNKQVFMVVLLLGVVACLLVYMLVFTKFNEQTETLKASNEELRTQVEDMKQYYDNMATYRADTKEMVSSISELTKDYPGDVREEDAIMMAVAMQSVAVLNYDQINVGASSVIHNVPVETVQGAAIEGMEEQVDFVRRNATYSNETTYASLKGAVGKVYDSDYRIGVNAVAFRKSGADNNYINGTISISYYSVRGMGKEYVAPAMPAYAAGSVDLFGPLYWSLKDGEGAVSAPEVETEE